MKTATLWRQSDPVFYAEEEADRHQRGEFLPQALADMGNDHKDCALPQRHLKPQKLKAQKPKLRLMPDPCLSRAPEPANNDGEAAIRIYLRAVGQVKLLSPKEEIGLVARIRKGDRKARERLIKGNLRRVVEISGAYENIGLSLLDLVSEGNLGLLKAVERFGPAEGKAFSDFSAWWIKQSIKRALSHRSQKHTS
jgi:RNA polymerase primary sigma factor